MRMFSRFVGVIFALALAGSASAQTSAVAVGSAPGMAGVAQTVKVTATVTAIDQATRDVTLKGPQGNELTVTAGAAVKNFASIKVGDKVDVQYVEEEALTLELKKGGGMVVARTEKSGAAGAKPGEKPAGAYGRQVTIVADVIGLDAAKQVVTLKGPQRTVDLEIADPEQFKRIAKGDQVEATFAGARARRGAGEEVALCCTARHGQTPPCRARQVQSPAHRARRSAYGGRDGRRAGATSIWQSNASTRRTRLYSKAVGERTPALPGARSR